MWQPDFFRTGLNRHSTFNYGRDTRSGAVKFEESDPEKRDFEKKWGVTLKDWRKWWNEFPSHWPRNEVYHQVGRTVGGVPTGEPDIVATSEAILSALRPSPTEIVLDLCCGNGLVTERIAPHCGRLIGVDFSEPLIRIARSRTPDVKFVVADVTMIDGVLLGVDRVDAAYLAFTFHNFDEEMASKLLSQLKIIAKPKFRLFLESIPDIDRIKAHYHTPERMAAHRDRKAKGTELIENWWSTNQLIAVARAEGFACELHMQGTDRVNNHYRFDALLTLLA
jgi:SAM-dependent methyltransferase